MPIPAEGKKAPAFTGTDQNGDKVSLAGLKGQKIVLYFYPQDDTPTCTDQACNLRDNFSVLKKAGFTVIGISPDAVAKHKKFEIKYNLPFTLLADPEHTIIDKYGVWGDKQLYGKKYQGLIRTTFLIDENGIIKKVFSAGVVFRVIFFSFRMSDKSAAGAVFIIKEAGKRSCLFFCCHNRAGDSFQLAEAFFIQLKLDCQLALPTG